MKKTIVFIILATFMLIFGQTPVQAAEVAGAAATLSMHFADVKLLDTRTERLRAFLKSHNSPMVADAGAFVVQADKYDLDWKLVAAIAGVESTFGKHIPYNSYNGWGWGVYTGTNDGIHFDSWADGIAEVSEGLRKNYIDRGAETIYEMGWIYAANGDSWSKHVRFFIDKIESYTP